MVKPFSRSGQRGRKNSWRTMQGRLGARKSASPAMATAPAAPALKRNWRLVVGIQDKRNYSAGIYGMSIRIFRITEARDALHGQLSSCSVLARKRLDPGYLTAAWLCPKESEVERRDQVDTTNGSAGGEWTALKAIRRVEVTRTQNAAGIRQIYIIKRVAGRSAK